MSHTNTDNLAEILTQTIAGFEHFLPAQAPIKDFVHHNTLHGFQHLEFEYALKQATNINGANSFIDSSQFREFFQQGRINKDDICQVIANDDDFDAKKIIYKQHSVQISTIDLIHIILTKDISPITRSQLNWQDEELNILSRFQADIDADTRKHLTKLYQANLDKKTIILKKPQIESKAIADLWSACIETLELNDSSIHAEEILLQSMDDKGDSLVDALVSDEAGRSSTHHKMQKQAAKDLAQLLDQVGDKITLRGLLIKLTGIDILEDIQPIIIRYVSSFLDLGFSPLHLERSKGFYHSWRISAKEDLCWVFDSLLNWHDMLESLPDSSVDAVITELQKSGIKEKNWAGYLNRLVMEIPGWSGMFFWFYQNKDYGELKGIPVEMMDYLAVRLILERIFAQNLCNKKWQFDANLDMFRWYFRHKSSELMVRQCFFKQQFPEFLATDAHELIEFTYHSSSEYGDWQQLADSIWSWLQTIHAIGKHQCDYSVCEQGWQLFILAQNLGLPGYIIRSFEQQQIEQIFNLVMQLDEDKKGFIWLQAYEINYREMILNMLVNNRNRGTWKEREKRPQAQTIFCMDDREESFRRHMEERNPEIETFGAAAHYNVFIDYKGNADSQMTHLCPVVAIPAHEIHEYPSADVAEANIELQKNISIRKTLLNRLLQNTRLGVAKSALTIALAAPFSLIYLVGKTLLPQQMDKLLHRYKNKFEKPVATNINTQAKQIVSDPSPENRQIGFSDAEQADRVETFLRNIGLIHNFSPVVVIFGHGSMSINNPHLAAYDCGACSGRHSGPNARTIAQFANRSEIRAILSTREINIPDDCLFIGAEHNTCDESIIWYDLEKSDKQFHGAIAALKQTTNQVMALSAHERCRKLACAPKHPSLDKALKHIVERGVDFSQARPELGHATNACAFIGRRSLTQGAFLDRRSFLISYNPNEDPEGLIIERLLLANGPVGAGISLEYYFSTVDNECYGSGSKITHNVSGLLGVMDGTSGDLRTGLPRQMIEIHEAMRLQVVVESSVEMLTKIYTRQPDIQELVGNGWILLCSIDPKTSEIFVFNPKKGFEAWTGKVTQLPSVDKSQDWYDGYDSHLPAVLIKSTEEKEHEAVL